MKKKINRLLWWAWFYRWLIVIVWRQVSGRWFYLRDVPDRIVWVLTRLEPDETAGDEARCLVEDAKAELRLRRMRSWKRCPV